MPTLKDVARKANVSIATVSRVLNNKASDIGITPETQALVRRVAQEINYHPNRFAQGLRTGRGLQHILFIYFQESEGDPFFQHPFFSHMLHGTQTAATNRNYYLSYLGVTTRNRESLLSLLDGQISGVVSWGTIPEDVYTEIRIRRLPLVAIEPYGLGDGDCPTVYVDNQLAVRQALEHLTSLGHRRIGLLCEGFGSFPPFGERLAAFRDWVEVHGVDRFEHQCLLDVPSLAAGGQTPDGSRSNPLAPWLTLPPQARPTAALAVSDMVALAAIRLMKMLGWRVPEDVSMVGIDDISWARLAEPPLTSVRIPQEGMGEKAISLLSRALQRTTATSGREFIATKLMVRQTTKARKEE